MTKPIVYDFTILENRALRRGSDFVHMFGFTYDITNVDFKAQIRNYNNDLIGEFEVTKSGTSILLRINKANLLLIPNGSYYWDLRQNDIYVMVGEVDIVTGVTQDGN